MYNVHACNGVPVRTLCIIITVGDTLIFCHFGSPNYIKTKCSLVELVPALFDVVFHVHADQ